MLLVFVALWSVLLSLQEEFLSSEFLHLVENCRLIESDDITSCDVQLVPGTVSFLVFYFMLIYFSIDQFKKIFIGALFLWKICNNVIVKYLTTS